MHSIQGRQHEVPAFSFLDNELPILSSCEIRTYGDVARHKMQSDRSRTETIMIGARAGLIWERDTTMNEVGRIDWGIVGAGHIAHRFAQGLAHVRDARLARVWS